MNFNLDLMLPYEHEVKVALRDVVDKKQFILGEQVRLFEQEFSAFTGQAHTIGVGNGTDAIRIALLALGVRPGDEVISPAFNVAYTALAVASIGAVNVFVDCDPDTLLMDLDQIEPVITSKTRAIVPVHLYGQMLDMATLRGIADDFGLMVVEDAAQAHGATFDGHAPGRYSHAVAYSFYPTKNLGALGEAGAVQTNIDIVADRARLLRDGGRTDRYLHVLQGINSCLDEMQAAVLRVKLPWLDRRNQQRIERAVQYRTTLADTKGMHNIIWDARARHVNHLFVIRAERRDALHVFLKSLDIPSLVHYPVPVPQQPCFMSATPGGPWHWSERAARAVLSLPMHPDITDTEVERVASAIKLFYT